MTNIVLIVMDTARADVVQPLSEQTPMPKLAEFAQRGTTFTSVHTNAPWTLPSHGTLFTGQYPSVHQAHANRKTFDHDPTLAQRLQDQGYNTIAISNNTWIGEEFGFDRGFEEFLSTWQVFQEGVDFSDVARTEQSLLNQLRGVARKFSGNPLKNVVNLLYGRFVRKRNDDGAKRTNDFVAENLDTWLADRPLFLFVNYLEPHLEYRPPDQFAREYLPENVSVDQAHEINQDAWGYITGDIDMTDRDFEILRSLYEAELAYLDKRIAELHELFVESDAADETIFIITGDHGENIGDYGLMDHQYSLHQSLLDVPLVIFGPKFDAEKMVERPVQLADIFPTVLDIANIPIPDTLPGQSIVEQKAIPDNRPLFAEYLAPQPEIETLLDQYDCQNDVWKYDRRLRSIYKDGWRYVRGSDGSEWLFDTVRCEGEVKNRVDEAPAVREDLEQRLDLWVDTLPSVRDDDTVISPSTEQRLEDLGYLQ